MTNIKIHQCPSCGGNLTVDNDRQMYHCSFCGSSFDYEYFREEQAHEMGEKYLSRGEYAAAIDLYKFVLDKDPHDFISLRGLMLASARLKEMKELTSKVGTEGFSYDTKQVDFICGSASPDDKEYFDGMSKIYSDIKSVSAQVEEQNVLRKEKRRIEDKIHLELKSREECSVKDRYGTEHDPIKAFIAMTAICGSFLLVILVLVIVGLFTEDWVVGIGFMLLLLAVPLTIIDFLIVFPRFKKAREIDARIGKYGIESGKRQRRINELGELIDKESSAIKHACSDLMKKDTKIMNELK